MTTAWVRLEEYIPTILKGWIRLKKKHFGDSVWDVEGDGYKGGCKHFKRFSIHTISDEENQKYKDDVVLFTKEKRKHYVPENIRVTINLNQFDYLLQCKKIAEKLDKRTNVPNLENDELINNLSRLKFRLNICKDTLRAMGNIIKDMDK